MLYKSQKKGNKEMKSILKYSGLTVMAIITLLITMDINSVTTRKDEMEESLTVSMRNTLKATNIYSMYEISDEEMTAEFIRNFADNVNTDSDFDIYINETSTQGIIDAKVRSKFKHLNGENGSKEVRKTLISEEYPKEE